MHIGHKRSLVVVGPEMEIDERAEGALLWPGLRGVTMQTVRAAVTVNEDVRRVR